MLGTEKLPQNGVLERSRLLLLVFTLRLCLAEG
jgi:hypothetical protein